MVRRTLVDDSSNVRSAAAQAFQSLQEAFGAKAIDETIPTLLEALCQPGASSGTALQALREVMNVSHVRLSLYSRTLLTRDISTGSRQRGVPYINANASCQTHHSIQRPSISIPRYCRRRGPQQTTYKYIGSFGFLRRDRV